MPHNHSHSLLENLFNTVCVCACTDLQNTSLHLQNSATDDVQTLLQLQLVDDQGRGKTDEVTMRGLGQQTIVPQLDAHIPCVVFCNENAPKLKELRTSTENNTGTIPAFHLHTGSYQIVS